MRRRLEIYFERRDCRAPDELADETLNRVTRRLDEEGAIEAASPAHYCYIVAKLVFHEYLRRATPLSDVSPDDSAAMRRAKKLREVEPAATDDLVDALEACLDALPPADRQLILDYYRGEQRAKIEQRRALAANLGVTINALSIRACRLRDRLEACVKSRTGT